MLWYGRGERGKVRIYERRRKTRTKLQGIFLKELEKEKIRLLVFKKENQIDDITEQVRVWFREWYYGYGFFPEFPYDVEGGTMMVIRGDYPTIQEKKDEDEKYLAATKGKTKEMLKQEKQQAKADALMRAEMAKEAAKKEAEQLLKLRCNPMSDPGYEVKTSELKGSLLEAFQNYRAAWSIYDRFPPETCADVVYGYIHGLLTEELMCQLHKDARKYVDELMRIDLKLLIKAQQIMYKEVGWKFPKMRTRPKPKKPSVPKPLVVDNALLKEFEEVFDLGIISKPTAKMKDVYGDTNYAAYDLNIRDPNATFPPPGYGDIKNRVTLSCIYGIGMDPGATRNKAVMLMGPPRNGKSFLVDVVAGELNAVKIDITPEVFSAVLEKPAKVLTQVFQVAKVFQPAVIYMRNVERVFAKKVPPEDKYLNAKVYKAALTKLLKTMLIEDKIIFIATCSDPFSAQPKPLVSLFDEVILVPRTDYGTVQRFFYEKLQSIRSMPRDYCVQALAQLMQGYGFGIITELYDKIMNPLRIVRLHITPLSPEEFLEPLIEEGIEPVTVEDYQEYVDFFITNSYLKREREEYDFINRYREVVYKKMAKEKKK
ncbi:IQ and AAA domain-containing protein 1-like [Ostrinia nubilalis]|uniref:IQ and AAA domain-containing protein 1-like n=1 Tax=Ostrinia nubilalis TaxID=29057 RepID=UPI0030823AB7